MFKTVRPDVPFERLDVAPAVTSHADNADARSRRAQNRRVRLEPGNVWKRVVSARRVEGRGVREDADALAFPLELIGDRDRSLPRQRPSVQNAAESLDERNVLSNKVVASGGGDGAKDPGHALDKLLARQAGLLAVEERCESLDRVVRVLQSEHDDGAVYHLDRLLRGGCVGNERRELGDDRNDLERRGRVCATQRVGNGRPDLGVCLVFGPDCHDAEKDLEVVAGREDERRGVVSDRLAREACRVRRMFDVRLDARAF